jgi:putative iron-regulated protein
MNGRLRPCLAVLLLGACAATPTWEDPEFRAEATRVVERYAELVSAAYQRGAVGDEQLHATIDQFVLAPSLERQTAAKAAWLGARDDYGRTEVFRFYGGPIDSEPDNLEARINSWPLDEAYIDYVDGAPDSGIINDLATYPTIDRDLLIARNGAEGEDSISTGWHALEFLLWGQDLAADGPGERPWTDFADAPDGTAANADRRREYLRVASELLLDDLQRVADDWSEGQSNYRASFVAMDPKEALTKVLLGMGSLAGAELAGERMTVALETREQEDEHSCFSDNTHRDLLANMLGIQDVYLGRIGSDAGPSLSGLVARLDPDLDARVRADLQAAVDAISAIPPPFDVAVAAPDGDPAREAVVSAVAALRAATDAIVAVADRLEIQLNLEE